MLADARTFTRMATSLRLGAQREDGEHRGVEMAASAAAQTTPAEPTTGGTDARWSRLTQAEQRVCLAITRGLSNKAIAHELTLSPRTVETHVTRVLRKLSLESRLQIGLFVRSSTPG